MYLGEDTSARRRRRAKRDVWCVDYRDATGARRRITAATDREITLAAYAEQWLGHIAADIKASTLTSYSETLDRYILPGLGRVKVRGLHRKCSGARSCLRRSSLSWWPLRLADLKLG